MESTQAKKPMTEPAASAGDKQAEPPRRRSRGRTWLFRLVALIVIPAAFFGLLELGLRLAGYGNDTRYFIPTEPVKNETGEILETNQRFAWLFYPPTGTKAPLPVRITPHKPADTVRVFVFGGSAAMGSPDPQHGFARVLEIMLAERYPNRKFEVIVTAMESMNSHVSRVIADEAARLEPDLFLVYLGNNEVVGPYGLSDVFRSYTPSLSMIRASLWVKSTRTGQLVGGLLDAISGQSTQVWKGMESFANASIRADDSRLAAARDHFADNLKAIRAAATRARAKSVLCSIASNLRDCAPFISTHKPGLAEAQRKRFDKLCADARRLADANDHAAAMDLFSQAAAIDDTSANLQFWMGRSCLAGARADEARKHFVRARDLDALRVRADSGMNDVIRKTGKEYDGFVDFEKILAADPLSRDGLPGNEVLVDHVHFNFAGNCRLAAAVLPEIQRVLADRLGPPSPAGATSTQPSTAELDEKHYARKLAMTGWDRFFVAHIVAAQMSKAPFTNQYDANANLARQRAKVERLRIFTLPEIHQAVQAQYLRALAERPDDTMLRIAYASCLDGLGHCSAAADEWGQLLDRFPDNAQFNTRLGLMLMRQGRFSEADAHFHAALDVMPHNLDVRNNLGASALCQGRLEEAAATFRRVLDTNADHTDARVNLGIILAKKNKQAAAAKHFQTVLKADPAHANALKSYARLLTSQGRTADAVECYRKALAAREDSHLHIGIARLLEQLGKNDEALEHLRRAAKLAPNAAPPQLALGQALLRARRYKEAADKLQRAVTFDDSLAGAHRDLGLVLEKLGSRKKAIVQLGRAVTLAPRDFVARERLAFLLLAGRRLGEAIDQYKKLLAGQPNLPDAHNNLAVALAKTGKLDEAIIHFTAAVRLEPTGLRHYNLATQLVRRGADKEAIKHFREAIRLRPKWPSAMAECAWVLATADEAELRNATQALTLATSACKLTGWKDPDTLDALAAALAESGDFSQAVTTAKTARTLAIQRGRSSQAVRIGKRLELYQAHKPCRRGAREVK